MTIMQNIEKIFTEIGPSITMVAAVKYATIEQIMTVMNAGVKDLGFNTYQQMNEVVSLLPEKARFHFIGTLQKNKVRKVLELNPYLIQSVDSFELAEKINEESKKQGRIQNILIQIKTDLNKTSGIQSEYLEDVVLKVEMLDNIKVIGLMTVPPYSENSGDSRHYFRAMKSYFEDTGKIVGRKLEYLSMGMSGDYMVAIEEGANMVRVGSRIFR